MNLTDNERRFLARKVIVDMLAELQALVDREHGNEGPGLGEYLEQLDDPAKDRALVDPATGPESPLYRQSEIDAYRMAVEDLERQRAIVEESAAFQFLMRQTADRFTAEEKADLQKAIRRRLSDPVQRAELAQKSGLYDRLEKAKY